MSHQGWQAGVHQKYEEKDTVHNGEEGKELAEDCQNLEGKIRECNKVKLTHLFSLLLQINLDSI